MSNAASIICSPMKPNLDRFSQPLHYEGRNLEREQELEAERADYWQDRRADREADEVIPPE